MYSYIHLTFCDANECCTVSRTDSEEWMYTRKCRWTIVRGFVSGVRNTCHRYHGGSEKYESRSEHHLTVYYIRSSYLIALLKDYTAVWPLKKSRVRMCDIRLVNEAYEGSCWTQIGVSAGCNMDRDTITEGVGHWWADTECKVGRLLWIWWYHSSRVPVIQNNKERQRMRQALLSIRPCGRDWCSLNCVRIWGVMLAWSHKFCLINAPKITSYGLLFCELTPKTAKAHWFPPSQQ